MLSKCCTPYVSKFGKPNSGHRTGKDQSSSQFPRRAVQKNVQTTGQLHSSPMLVRLFSKFCILGFSSTWTENFQLFKLGSEKAEELETKLQTFSGSYRKQGNSRKNMYIVSLTMLMPLTVWIITNWKTLKEMGISACLKYLMRNLYAGQETTARPLYGTGLAK